MHKSKFRPGTVLEALTSDGKPRCQWPKRIYDENNVPLEYGVQCGNKSVPSRPYCRWHGGNSGAPVKHGNYSKYTPVPKNLQKKFEEALNNPDLLNLSRGIALMDSQIWELAEEASTQDNFTAVQRKQLSRLLKEHKDLVAQETQRRIAMGSLMDVAQVMQIMNFIYDSVVKNIHDANARIRISADIRSIISENFPITNSKSNDLGVSQTAAEPDDVELEPGEEPDYDYVNNKDGESEMIDEKLVITGRANDPISEEKTDTEDDSG